MREIKSALIVGAGAIGAAVASRIYDVDPEAIALWTVGERRERYLRDGLIINGRRYDFHMVEALRDGPSDLILIAVKSYDLAEAIEGIRPFVGPDTTILSLLNGIDSEEILRAEFGMDRVPLAFMIGIDSIRIGNKTEFACAGEIRFGFEHNDPTALNDRVAAVSRFFSSHNVDHTVPENMVRALWFKFMLNVGLNQWSALLRGSYGLFQKSASARKLLVETMKEVVALSDACGKGLVLADIDTVLATLEKLEVGGRTSMLQDVDARRKTEVEIFSGVVIEKCRECGLSAPINESLFLAIKALEDSFRLDLALP